MSSRGLGCSAGRKSNSAGGTAGQSRSGWRSPNTQQGVWRGTGTIRDCRCRERKATKRRAGKKTEDRKSSVERLASFPDCPMARNVSSKSLRSLDQQYEQMLDKR